MVMKSRTLKLEIEVETHKDARGRIHSYTARYPAGVEGTGKTEDAAIAALRHALSRVVAGVAQIAIISDPVVDYHVIAFMQPSGYFGYRHFDVQDNRVTLRSSGGHGEATLYGTREQLQGYLHSRTHCYCKLCHTEKPNESVVYYSTVSAGAACNAYHVCKSCEDERGLADTMQALKREVGHMDPHTLVRCGEVAADGTHPPIPESHHAQ